MDDLLGQIDAPDDDAYNFVVAIAAGELTDLDKIADQLRRWSTPA